MSNDKDQRIAGTLRQTVLGILFGEVNTHAPGEVVSYDAASQTASIQPCDKQIFPDGSSALLPILQNVPVLFLGGGSFCSTFPIADGDTCLLLYAQRSLDAWLELGTPSEPSSGRMFSINDAIAIVGLTPSTRALTPPPTDRGAELRTRDRSTFLTVTDGVVCILGDVSIKGTLYANEVIVQTTPATAITVSTHTHPHGLGPTAATTPLPAGDQPDVGE